LSDLPPTPARSGDLPEVLELVRSFGLPTEGISGAFPQAYAVMRRGSELVAVAGLEIYDDVGLLRSVAVAKQERGRGLGRALVADRLAAAREQRLKCVYLLTLTAADYFRGLGFSDTERARAPASVQQAPEFTTLCPASAACLVLCFEAGA
jgi:N-acetylglutamate synthase-like GNAT family acetyltransferase